MAAGVATVKADSYLTLHYRLSLADGGIDVVNTFGGNPATFQLGFGQMAEPLEHCLIGLAEGSRAVFELEPQSAFGARNPALVQRVSRALLDRQGEPGARRQPGDQVEFGAPEGGRFAGVLKEIDERSALLDFNHPLAGRRVRLEVQILAVL